jgi:tetratricopeptide (TPR) repeat protein
MQKAYAVMSDDEPDADLAMVAHQLGRFLAIAARYREAMPLLEQALTLAEQLELTELYARGLSSRGVALQIMGRPDEAETLQRRAVRVALDNGFSETALRAYNNLGAALEGRDRFHDMLDICDQAIAVARRSGSRGQELAALASSVGILMHVGRWDDALGRAQEAESAAELKTMQWVRSQLSDVVTLHVRRGEMDAASERADSIRGYATSPNVELRCMFFLVEAERLLAQGSFEEALQTALQAVEARERLGLAHGMVKRALVLAVQAALAIGDTEKAEELLGIVESARPGEVSPYLRAHAARLAARVAAAKGIHDATVEAGFAAAEREFRTLGLPWDLATTLLESAEWLAGRGRMADAQHAAEEALALFRQLGARPSIERASRLVVAEPGLAPVTT